jgi:methylenetetrahydrofolate reductase (NADPH)
MADAAHPAAALAGGLASRLEVLPFDSAEEQLSTLNPGTTITVTVSPNHGVDHTLAFSERWAARDLDVVPHLAARMVVDADHATRVAERILAAGMREIFVVGGDRSPPLGDYHSAGELLHDLRPLIPDVRIGIAGYPEGHPLIPDLALREALRSKAEVASVIVTQLCFDWKTTAAWVRSIRDLGVTLPVLVGVPGVVERRKLLELATRVGVGASTRYLRRNLKALAKLLVHSAYDPTGLVEEVLRATAEPSLGIAGLHLFTFNQIGPTDAWRAASSAGVRSTPSAA